MSQEIEECEEIFAVNESKETEFFDRIMGHLQNVLISDEFLDLQNKFLSKHCEVFCYEEENKLEYMDIFTAYTDVVESYVESELCRLEPGFNMNLFMHDVKSSDQFELNGDVADLLLTFTDFIAFKSIMVDHRKARELSRSLDNVLQITNL